jgi:hypothetical protein
MTQKRTDTRTPQSARVGAAAGALIQAILGLEFLLGGLNKVFAPDYVAHFKDFASSAPGAQHGAFSQIVQVVVLPHVGIMAQLARFTELSAGIVLLVTAAELARLQFTATPGRRLQPAVALVTATAAAAIGGLSLTIYLLQGGMIPGVNPALAFGPPIAIELFNVPLALGISAMEFSRFLALRNVSLPAAKHSPEWGEGGLTAGVVPVAGEPLQIPSNGAGTSRMCTMCRPSKTGRTSVRDKGPVIESARAITGAARKSLSPTLRNQVLGTVVGLLLAAVGTACGDTGADAPPAGSTKVTTNRLPVHSHHVGREAGHGHSLSGQYRYSAA